MDALYDKISLQFDRENPNFQQLSYYSRQMPTIELRINIILRLLVTFCHFPVTFYHFPPSFKNQNNDSDAVQIQTVAGKYNVTKSK